MPRYAAFLRGINVGGRRASGEQLRECLTKLGFTDAASFRASGNLIFGSPGGEDPERLAARIEAGLTKSLGYEVAVFLRGEPEVRAIASHEPFDAEQLSASGGKLQVMLLARKPSAPGRRKVLALASAEDRLALRGRELYWLPSGGIMDSELDLDAIGSLLGTSTMRTKGTIEQIAARHFTGPGAT